MLGVALCWVWGEVLSILGPLPYFYVRYSLPSYAAYVSRLDVDLGVENLPSAVAVFEGEDVDFSLLVAAPGFLAAVGFHIGFFVPVVAGFQAVGLVVVGPGLAGGLEVLDAVDDPAAAPVECFYLPVDFEFSVICRGEKFACFAVVAGLDAVVNPLVPGVHGFADAVGGLFAVAVFGRVGLGDVLGGAVGVCFAVFAGAVAGATA